jgi:hypothetical protein
MEILHIPAGSTVYSGKPANPLPRNIEQEISRGLSVIGGIVEAHLPMCYVREIMPKPALVLVVVVDPVVELDSLMSKVGQTIRHALPKGTSLDIWPIEPKNSMLPLVRNAGCTLFAKGSSKSSSSALRNFFRRR